MKATEMLHILKVQNKRLFIIWLVTFIAFIGLLGYTIYLLNDIGVIETDTKTQEISDIDTVENSNITNGDVNGQDKTSKQKN
jgi:hypothetical protein